jgi:hypothetical protein
MADRGPKCTNCIDRAILTGSRTLCNRARPHCSYCANHPEIGICVYADGIELEDDLRYNRPGSQDGARPLGENSIRKVARWSAHDRGNTRS